jgi:hypothetical protein
MAKEVKVYSTVVDIDGEITVGYDEQWLKQKLNL